MHTEKTAQHYEIQLFSLIDVYKWTKELEHKNRNKRCNYNVWSNFFSGATQVYNIPFF